MRKLLELQEQFLKEGRDFCFQSKTSCTYFNFALSSAGKGKPIYYHSDTVEGLTAQIEQTMDLGRDVSVEDNELIENTAEKDLNKEVKKMEVDMEDLL